jgi:hypothetical protein
MQGAARSQWLFHWQASLRSKRRPAAQPEGPEGILAESDSINCIETLEVETNDRQS